MTTTTRTVTPGIPFVIPTKSEVPTAHLVLRNEEGQVIQQWLIRQNKCTLGSARSCTLRCELEGVAPYHALLVVGAKQMFVRALAPKLTQNGVSVNELLLTDKEPHFEIAGYRFELNRGAEDKPTGNPEQQQRLRFALARPFDLQPKRRSQPSPSPKESADKVQDSTAIARLIQSAIEPLECQLQNVLQPIAALQDETRKQREATQKLAEQQDTQRSKTEFEELIAERNAEEQQRLANAEQFREQVQEMTVRQSSAMDVIGERIADVTHQLTAIENIISQDIEEEHSRLHAQQDATNEKLEVLNHHGSAIEQLQSGMVNVSHALQSLEARQVELQSSDEQWQAGIQEQVTSLRDSIEQWASNTASKISELATQSEASLQSLAENTEADLQQREESWRANVEEQFAHFKQVIDELATRPSTLVEPAPIQQALETADAKEAPEMLEPEEENLLAPVAEGDSLAESVESPFAIEPSLSQESESDEAAVVVSDSAESPPVEIGETSNDELPASEAHEDQAASEAVEAVPGEPAQDPQTPSNQEEQSSSAGVYNLSQSDESSTFAAVDLSNVAGVFEIPGGTHQEPTTVDAPHVELPEADNALPQLDLPEVESESTSDEGPVDEAEVFETSMNSAEPLDVERQESSFPGEAAAFQDVESENVGTGNEEPDGDSESSLGVEADADQRVAEPTYVVETPDWLPEPESAEPAPESHVENERSAAEIHEQAEDDFPTQGSMAVDAWSDASEASADESAEAEVWHQDFPPQPFIAPAESQQESQEEFETFAAVPTPAEEQPYGTPETPGTPEAPGTPGGYESPDYVNAGSEEVSGEQFGEPITENGLTSQETERPELPSWWSDDDDAAQPQSQSGEEAFLLGGAQEERAESMSFVEPESPVDEHSSEQGSEQGFASDSPGLFGAPAESQVSDAMTPVEEPSQPLASGLEIEDSLPSQTWAEESNESDEGDQPERQPWHAEAADSAEQSYTPEVGAEVRPQTDDPLVDHSIADIAAAESAGNETTVEDAPPEDLTDEENVEDYMRKLLARMRGVPEEEVSRDVDTNSVVGDPGETSVADLAPISSIEPLAEVEAADTVNGLASEEVEDYRPRVSAPEQTRSLAAMRELANTSARSAIHNSTRKRQISSLLLKGSIAIIGLIVGVTLLIINGFALNIGLIATIAAFFVAGIWGYDSINSLGPILEAGLDKQEEAAKVEAAKGEETDLPVPQPIPAATLDSIAPPSNALDPNDIIGGQ